MKSVHLIPLVTRLTLVNYRKLPSTKWAKALGIPGPESTYRLGKKNRTIMVRMPEYHTGDPDIFWFNSISLRGGTRCSTLCPRPHCSGRSRHTSHLDVTRHTTQPQITEQRALVDSVILQPPTMAVQKSCSLRQVVTRVEAYVVLKIPDTPHTLQHTQHTASLGQRGRSKLALTS